MTIKALLFDFDGVVIESEMPAFQSWQEIFEELSREPPRTASVGTDLGLATDSG